MGRGSLWGPGSRPCSDKGGAHVIGAGRRMLRAVQSCAAWRAQGALLLQGQPPAGALRRVAADLPLPLPVHSNLLLPASLPGPALPCPSRHC